MKKLGDFLKGKCECTQVGLLILRILPGYFLAVNHGWNKITHPEKWTNLGGAASKLWSECLISWILYLDF